MCVPAEFAYFKQSWFKRTASNARLNTGAELGAICRIVEKLFGNDESVLICLFGSMGGTFPWVPRTVSF